MSHNILIFLLKFCSSRIKMTDKEVSFTLLGLHSIKTRMKILAEVFNGKKEQEKYV